MGHRLLVAAHLGLFGVLGDDAFESSTACPEALEDADEAEVHEVLLLQVESTVRRTARVKREVIEHRATSPVNGSVMAVSGAQVPLAQDPSHSNELVPEGKLAACQAIAGPYSDNTVGGPECRQPLPEEDLARPFREVLAEHPGVTGWCHYGGEGAWVSSCAASMEVGSYVPLAVQYGAITMLGVDEEREEAMEHGIGPPHVIGYQGENFFTDYNYLAYDSLYCLDNGWLNQTRYRLEDVYDFDRMNELSQSNCNDLLSEFPDLHEYSMQEHYGFSSEESIVMNREQILPFGMRLHRGPTLMENRRHAAWKCAMGGLGCDIANCIYSYCTLDEPVGHGTFIGHGRQCREDWLPREDVEAYVDTIGNGVEVPPFS